MKLLLDECVPARFRRLLPDHEVITVPKRGWAGIKNGELLGLAQNEFDVLITVDRNLPAEQKLEEFKLAVVLLRAKTNRLQELRSLVPQLLSLLPSVGAGKSIEITG